MVGQYVILALIMLTLPVNRENWCVIAGALIAGSLVVGLFTIAQTLGVTSFNEWVYSTYLASNNLQAFSIQYPLLPP